MGRMSCCTRRYIIRSMGGHFSQRSYDEDAEGCRDGEPVSVSGGKTVPDRSGNAGSIGVR
jgi:hypothetical protein